MKTIKKYKHFLPVVVYGIFYLKCFQYLETHITKGYHLIHTPFDDMIPFCEFFVIPYFMWFIPETCSTDFNHAAECTWRSCRYDVFIHRDQRNPYYKYDQCT